MHSSCDTLRNNPVLYLVTRTSCGCDRNPWAWSSQPNIQMKVKTLRFICYGCLGRVGTPFSWITWHSGIPAAPRPILKLCSCLSACFFVTSPFEYWTFCSLRPDGPVDTSRKGEEKEWRTVVERPYKAIEVFKECILLCFFILCVRLLALRPLLVYCASLGW
jgi:hypothetical protein